MENYAANKDETVDNRGHSHDEVRQHHHRYLTNDRRTLIPHYQARTGRYGL